jgi:hypothetical protein
MRAFTVPELASRLSVTPQTARARRGVDRLRQAARDAGNRFAGQKMYEYVPPTDPGSAFKVQQAQARSRERGPVSSAAMSGDYTRPVAGTGKPAGQSTGIPRYATR